MLAPLQQQPTEAQIDAARRILGHSHKKKFAKRSKGATVRAMQIFLASKGYNVGRFDGDWGNKTEAAFQEYLKEKGASSRNASKQILNDMGAELMPLPNMRPENAPVAPVDPMAPDQIPMPPMRPEPPVAEAATRFDQEAMAPPPASRMLPPLPGELPLTPDQQFMANMARGPIKEQPAPRFDEEPMAPPPENAPEIMPENIISGGSPQMRPAGMDDPDQNLGPGSPMFDPMMDAQALAARSNTVRGLEEPWEGMSAQDEDYWEAGELRRQRLAEEEADRLLSEANSPAAAGGPAYGDETMIPGAVPANPMRDALLNPGMAPQFQPQPQAGMNPAMDRLREALLRGMVPPQMMAGR